MAEFEERADQLSLDTINQTLADGLIFETARKKLLTTGAKLLVGPRGTGKTHLMRYTYAAAMRKENGPLALYANFNRYLNLEPLLKRSPDALKRFHSWVIAKLLLSAFDYLRDMQADPGLLSVHDQSFNEANLRELVALLERGSGDAQYEDFGQNLTVDHVIKAVGFLCKKFSRKRAVLFLDDAALSLTDQYLVAFFEIYRLLKTENIAPKAAVYPGSTQYGPTFHAFHEAEEVPLWLSVEDIDYSKIMGEIAQRRLTADEISQINPDVLEFFKYMAFGVPRAYLILLREFLEADRGTSQQRINRIVERQVELIGAEYDSLGIKLKQFASLVATGRKFFDHVISAVVNAKNMEPGKKNITLALLQGEDRNPLTERMLRFLVEIGMLYPLQSVSHGPKRIYDRYIPHMAFLQQKGVFRDGKGFAPKDVADYMGRPMAKQPIRRTVATILGRQDADNLKLDLPNCQNCHVPRLSGDQLFCHKCGAELVSSSLFEECMQLTLDRVPGVSGALLAHIHRDTKLRTIGHVYASQNASAELQQATWVGPVRAGGIIKKVTLSVDEFLS